MTRSTARTGDGTPDTAGWPLRRPPPRTSRTAGLFGRLAGLDVAARARPPRSAVPEPASDHEERAVLDDVARRHEGAAVKRCCLRRVPGEARPRKSRDKGLTLTVGQGWSMCRMNALEHGPGRCGDHRGHVGVMPQVAAPQRDRRLLRAVVGVHLAGRSFDWRGSRAAIPAGVLVAC